MARPGAAVPPVQYKSSPHAQNRDAVGQRHVTAPPKCSQTRSRLVLPRERLMGQEVPQIGWLISV